MRIYKFLGIGSAPIHAGRIRRLNLGRDLIGCQAGPEIDVIGAFVNGWHPAVNPVHVVCIGIFVVPRKTGFSLLIRVMPG